MPAINIAANMRIENAKDAYIYWTDQAKLCDPHNADDAYGLAQNLADYYATEIKMADYYATEIKMAEYYATEIKMADYYATEIKRTLHWLKWFIQE